jgi:hypothetical protein
MPFSAYAGVTKTIRGGKLCGCPAEQGEDINECKDVGKSQICGSALSLCHQSLIRDFRLWSEFWFATWKFAFPAGQTAHNGSNRGVALPSDIAIGKNRLGISRCARDKDWTGKYLKGSNRSRCQHGGRHANKYEAVVR